MKRQKHCLIFTLVIKVKFAENILGDSMRTKPIYVFCYITLFVFFLTSSCLFANVDTLKRIADAESETAYVGLRLKTSSTSHGARTVEEFVIHRSAEESYRRFVSVVGSPKSITEENGGDKKQENRDKNERSRRSREFRWDRHSSQFSVKAIELIAHNYELELRHWGEKIAGHETDLLIIKPKHPNRSTKHIYFARKNGVILRVEDLDAAGILRNMFVYTRISFDPKAVDVKWDKVKEDIKPQPWHNRPVITLSQAGKILKKKPIQPTYLPAGFKLQGIYKRQFRGIHIQLKYTDGLLDISLFETKNEVRSESTDRPSNRGERNRQVPVIKIGETSVYKGQRGSDYIFNWRKDGVLFTILSPIPPSELQKVAESIIVKAD